MGQQQVKALTERGKSAKNNRSITKNKEVEKPEFHTVSGKLNVSHALC